MEVRLMTSQQNGHVPEFAAAVLEAASGEVLSPARCGVGEAEPLRDGWDGLAVQADGDIALAEPRERVPHGHERLVGLLLSGPALQADERRRTLTACRRESCSSGNASYSSSRSPWFSPKCSLAGVVEPRSL